MALEIAAKFLEKISDLLISECKLKSQKGLVEYFYNIIETEIPAGIRSLPYDFLRSWRRMPY